ncbi:restriction endonuclease subunit S [Escherichia coli]|uniref:restriction endonuclease subunit S n=1 Tax=Escherichia coli TaxID=562 RepID=UPI001767F481|nr:restriction endonuclease subunit S [Escherichia coli]MCV5776776.1 restriction endonuclease subunit S [Escherichia coli]MDZ8688933.1 restriction endonuclease subunit S [Escherichia coli]MEA0558747.1 restriction endonuclease subunit S [Escherichia coli]HAH1291530.1 restriction endonuclease subunit S [Escherichia coli]HAJ7839082.1 restriction endonuclease subunit S [Escherichia coli]
MSELSYLEKLLDGVEVEWVPVSELFQIKNGYTPSKSKKEFWENGTIPWFRLEDVRVNGRELNDSIQHINPLGVKGCLFPKNSIFMSTTATIGEYALVRVPYLTNQQITNFSISEKFSEAVNIKYIFYRFYDFGKWCTENANKSGGVSIIGLKKLSQYQFPIPCPDNPEKSLAIQSEIVRILDKFTALTAELTAELNMRKKQYNYYRDQLLSFDESSVEWKTLLEACDYVDYRGKTPKKTQSGIFLVTAKNIRMGYIDYHASQEFISEEDYAIVMRRGLPKKGDVLITTEAPCGFVAQVNRENIALAQRVIKYRSKNTQLSNSFLKHYLLGSQFQDKLMQAATGSTVKGIKGSRLHQLKIPIPSKVEQDRIVAILDKFDTLTNSITEGLPREIELRQKQYEYYRDLLFSFPKPETVSN